MNLQGKRILITGGTSGIGRATVELLSQLGAQLIVVSRDPRKLQEIKGELRGSILEIRRADLEVEEDVVELSKWVQSSAGRLDAVINNASRNSRFSVLNTELQEWKRMITLNLTAPFLISQAAARRMIQDGVKGKIINVGAIQYKFPLAESLPYVTTKGGLVSMTRSMAVDLGPYGIQVICVVPGPIYTKGDRVPPELDARASTVLGRMGRPEEVARLLAFLCSDWNSFMTGNVIVIDGGRLISRKPDPGEVVRGEV
jgi:NAD(P)-dependent dehydrogenase (short-subunit alcohol dehydrogenase family)